MDVFLPSSAGSHLERVFWNKVLNSGYIGGSQNSKFFVCDLANIHFRPASWVESHSIYFIYFFCIGKYCFYGFPEFSIKQKQYMHSFSSV